MPMINEKEMLEPVPIIAILRGYSPSKTIALAEACWDANISLVEVPVQDADGWQALKALANIAQGRLFGAGTVLNERDAQRALDLGVSVLIAPGIEAQVARFAQAQQVTYIPGVATPSDIMRAYQLGIRLMKYFPASALGLPYLKAMQGPFPDARFIAVGGITIDNISDFLDAGAIGVGMGSHIETYLSSVMDN